MNTLTITILFIIALMPLALCYFNAVKKTSTKKVMLFTNIALVCCVAVFSVTSVFAVPANATEQPASTEVETVETITAPAESKLANVSIGAGIGIIAAALVTAVSCIGAGIAVASSASAAIGAISENPAIFGKAMIFVALAEGVALYGMLISIQIIDLFK